MSTRFLKWGLVGALFAVTLIFSLTYFYRAPFHDHWDIVPYFDRLQGGTLAFSDLFALHGNHWHASGYLVQLGLAQATGMAHWAESLASVLVAGLGFVALARILDRSLELFGANRLTLWVFGFGAFFLFSLDQAANWLWGWQVAVFLNITGALWAIERLSRGAPTLLNTFLGILAAAVSIYAFGTGWALIPIGFALLFTYGALKSGEGMTCLILWTAFTALLLWHFSLALTDSSAAYTVDSTPDFFDPTAILGLIDYAINFVASPIVRFARDSALVCFLIGAGLLIWSVWTLNGVAKEKIWQGAAPFLALAAYSMGAGLLTAIGRWETFGAKHAFVSRYISFGTFFWIAVFALALFAIARNQNASRKVAIGAVGLLFVMKIGNIPSVVQKTVGLSNDIKTAAHILAEDYPDAAPEDFSILHQPGQEIGPRLDMLKTQQVSLFRAAPEAEEDAQ
ncbi:MAG: hypothetical protein NXH78_16265 [Hyphomonadaceae bacterium]|nr:hypothetical protein [Hyphomonadaceae bacterium]